MVVDGGNVLQEAKAKWTGGPVSRPLPDRQAYTNADPMAGQTAIVTGCGSASAIGYAIALRLSKICGTVVIAAQLTESSRGVTDKLLSMQ